MDTFYSFYSCHLELSSMRSIVFVSTCETLPPLMHTAWNTFTPISFNICPVKSCPVAHLLAYKYLLTTFYVPGRVGVDEKHKPFLQGVPGIVESTQNNSGATISFQDDGEGGG